MSVAKAAPFLDCKPAHLRKLLSSGRVKGFRLAGEWRINPSDLLEYIYEHRNY